MRYGSQEDSKFECLWLGTTPLLKLLLFDFKDDLYWICIQYKTKRERKQIKREIKKKLNALSVELSGSKGTEKLIYLFSFKILVIVLHFFFPENSDGYYIYTEVSTLAMNRTARIQSKTITPQEDVQCLTFWYHMYGDSTGTLNFYIKTGSGLGSIVWTRTGSQGNQWTKAAVTISQGRTSYAVSS